MTQGTNTERNSGRGANWNQALQTADAGVEQAIALMQESAGNPGDFTGDTADGTFMVTITSLGRNRYEIQSTGTAGQGPGLVGERTVRVVMGPPKSFQFALFSLTDIDTKNNDIVNGDVWANGSVTVDQNDEINGDVTAATGIVTMRNGSTIDGDVVTGGYNASGNAMELTTVTGTATAASTSPGCVDDFGHSNYKITGGTVQGNATSWGSIASTVNGTKTTHVCTSAPATKTMPTFTYNAANYSPAPQVFTSPAGFAAYVNLHENDMHGTFYVTGGGQNDPVDITGISISGDLTIIATDAPITADQGSADVTSANDDDKILVLVSYYQPPQNVACATNGGNPGDCAIGVKNNFQVDDNTATLVYAPNGPVAFKNNADFVGAVYANNIVMKNNQTTTYDARVDQIIGFGPVTLERESWVEISD
ncbi:MAG: hypothetical protein ACT4OX_12095 [Actinomycetota bacterium]